MHVYSHVYIYTHLYTHISTNGFSGVGANSHELGGNMIASTKQPPRDPTNYLQRNNIHFLGYLLSYQFPHFLACLLTHLH